MGVQFPPRAYGPLAQLVERCIRIAEVAGSIPARSTTGHRGLRVAREPLLSLAPPLDREPISPLRRNLAGAPRFSIIVNYRSLQVSH